MRRRLKREKGVALITSMGILATVLVAGTTYVNMATQNARLARIRQQDTVLLNLSESAIQTKLLALWKPFKNIQRFTDLDNLLTGASATNPKSSSTSSLISLGNYTAGVVSYTQPDAYTRFVTVRGIGWIDRNKNGQLDSTEPRKIIDVTTQFALGRSAVFDYAYFVNNYGWMNGFSANELVVNGDMRANGNFDFSGGTPTINGSVYAAANDKLDPPAPGFVNITPSQWNNSSYATNSATDALGSRWRQAYDAAKHGAKGTAAYDQWRDLIYDNVGEVVNSRIAGAVVGDARGVRTYGGTTLDPNPTQEVPMPDLSDINYYLNKSRNWRDPKANFQDGTPNPDYNQLPYMEVWDQTLNGGAGAYKRVTTNGVYENAAAQDSLTVIGDSAHPIKIHGPVTVKGDLVIKGYVQGQGTIYTGRNVHVVGSVMYKNPPDFRGNNPTTIDRTNEKRDILALAARGSIIMGDTSTFGSNPLQYMTPPFTHGRYDDNGNYIAPYNAMEVDSYGIKKYQSLVGDTKINQAFNLNNGIAKGVKQMDAILYTNFVGGGNLATGGGGCTFNGSIISKDEAMVLYSLPLKINYDNRIKERGPGNPPLIDIELPRAPNLTRMTWQHQGTYGK